MTNVKETWRCCWSWSDWEQNPFHDNKPGIRIFRSKFLSLYCFSLIPSCQPCFVSVLSVGTFCFLFFHILSHLFRRGKRLTIKILYEALCDSINDTSIQDQCVDSMIQQQVKTSSHNTTIVQKHLTAGPCIISSRNRIISYRIVSYRGRLCDIGNYHPKNQYNIVSQSPKRFYTSKLYFCWGLIIFLSLVTALCSCSVRFRHINESQKTSDVQHRQHPGSATIMEAGDGNQLGYVRHHFIKRMKRCRLRSYVINTGWR